MTGWFDWESAVRFDWETAVRFDWEANDMLHIICLVHYEL